MVPVIPPSDSKPIDLSVRTLAEHVYKRGDLSSFSFMGISGAEGTRLHRRVFADLEKQYQPSDIETECSLSAEYALDSSVTLRIRGRADCVLTGENGAISVLEIKSTTAEKLQGNISFQETHWAQVMLYSYMYLESMTDAHGVFACLRYVSIETMEYTEKREWVDRLDAAKFFQKTCEAYVGFAKNELDYMDRRDESVKEMPFPYPTIRSGQKDLMKQVLHTIVQKSPFFAAAPTGIGKTVSTLFPALKSLSNGKSGKIFYLTAKSAARIVARKALKDMRDKGLFLRSVSLQAKESFCPNPQLYCEAKICPRAIGYYDRLPKALHEALNHMDIYPELLFNIAEKHNICPHELSLDVSMYCDVIIGDYNHAFHPRIRLERYFETKDSSFVLLVDEAHNLVDRSRDMFSAVLTRTNLELCKAALTGMDKRVDAFMTDIQKYFLVVTEAIRRDEDGFSLVEKEVEKKDVMSAGGFRGMRCVPKILYALLWKFCHFVRPVLDTIPAGDVRKVILQFYFDARFFLTILELYFDSAYVVTMELEESGAKKSSDLERKFALTPYDGATMTLLCLDASSKIRTALMDRHSAVFFSATLSPAEYYQIMLLGGDAEARAERLSLPSPFPPENLAVYVVQDVKTTYQARMGSSERVASFILRSARHKPGNYLVFLPSFQYLRMIHDQIASQITSDEPLDLLRQTENMTREAKESYLHRFESSGTRTLLGFAVLGGHFGEGIDLVGDRLNGVFIVGVGLPRLCPQREIMRQYFQENLGDGFAFAYRFPGWEKVLQAAGRVIRDDEDTGFVVLMDERYERPEYRSLFPEHWDPIVITSDDEIT